MPNDQRDITLRLLQDQKHRGDPSFESCLRDATSDLIKSDLTLEVIIPLHERHPQF